MDIKKKRKLILDAAENSIDELIKVMNKRMDPDELDPENISLSLQACNGRCYCTFTKSRRNK